METSIEQAVRLVGGQSALAKKLSFKHSNIKQQHVWKWVRAGRVPAEYCNAIEKATNGAVTRYDLRPDVFGPAPTDHHRRATDQQAA